MRDKLIKAGIAVVEEDGLNRLFCTTVAKAANCSHGLMFHYFDNMEDFKRVIAYSAIHDENLRVIRMLIADNDSSVQNIEPELFRRALIS